MDHANTRYDFYGSAPEIEKLFGDRYRIIVRCELQDLDQDWFYENEDQIWKDFGDPYELALKMDGASDGWEPITGETYPNQKLVGTQLLFIPQKGTPTLEFTYETLTDEFVDESQEALGETENGLLTMTRTRIATRTTDYSLEVGVSNTYRGSSNIYLARYQEDDLKPSEGGFKRIQEVWIEKGILSVSQTFNNGRGEVAVQAFGMTDSQVDVELSEVTYQHVLISESKSQYKGYPTITYTYELEQSFTEDYELNGLKRVNLIELGTSNFLPQTIGDVGTLSPVVGLYLGVQDIDNGGQIKVRESTWFEAGTLQVSSKNEAEGIIRKSTTFLVEEDISSNSIVGRETSNFEGLQTITVTELTDKDGNPLAGDGSTPVSSYDRYVDFRYPGEVSIATDTDTIGTPAATTWNSFWYSLNPPVTSRVKARYHVFFQSSSEIAETDLVYDDALGLWNPISWAKGVVDGLGTNYQISSVRQIAQDKAFTEYTTVEGGNNSYSGTGGFADQPGGAILVEGSYITPTAAWSIEVSGGPGRPDGEKYVLDVSFAPAFDDVDGNQIWKKTILVADIPDRFA